VAFFALMMSIQDEADGKERIKLLAGQTNGLRDAATFEFLVGQFHLRSSNELQELDDMLRYIREA
jgi:hypothetical protein